MEYWVDVNKSVVGSNYKGMQNNNDLYRHADIYRSYYCYYIGLNLPSKPQSKTDNEQYLIVWAFSQKSFELAKRETKLLKS
jgi:hypothetical protein